MSLEMEHVRTWKLNWNMSLQMEHVRTFSIWNMSLELEHVRIWKLSGTCDFRWKMSGQENYLEHITWDWSCQEDIKTIWSMSLEMEHVRTWKLSGTCCLRWNMSGHENYLEHVTWDRCHLGWTWQDMKTSWNMSLKVDRTFGLIRNPLAK